MAIAISSSLCVMVLGMLIYILLPLIKTNKLKEKFIQTKSYNKLSEYILIISKRNLFSKKINITSPLVLLTIMFILFIVMFFVFYLYIKVFSTAVILAIPFFLAPVLIIKILINKEKARIIKILPMYVVNIKNHISDENNIITAIQRTTVEEPLVKYIEGFKARISRGMNVVEAFDMLKKDVNVKVFDSFISACQVCYLNGGDFSKVLDRYINIITKENIQKESTKEKAYTDIITLIIMVVLNILVVVLFVFTNKEYAEIIRETFVGKLILNMNAFSYILIAYLVSRIYKEE